MSKQGSEEDDNRIISKAELEHSSNCSIRNANENGVWLYVDNHPEAHVTPTELRSMVEERDNVDLH